jgi:hypothetical protein
MTSQKPMDSRSTFLTTRSSVCIWWSLIGIVGIAFAFHVGGIRKNLPYTAESDEGIFVSLAMHIAASGNLNPGWFGNPGSTVIYPLAGMYHIWYALTHGGMLTQPNPDLLTTFWATPAEFYMLGRFLTIAYSVLSVPLTYRIGQQVFGKHIGLIGAWFLALSLLPVSYAQVVRTDSAATFFTVLSLWLCLRLYECPTIKNQIWAGGAIGLSIASRYFCVALIPVLIGTNLLIAWRHFSKASRKFNWAGIAVGLVALVVTFALSTPYFFLDFATARANLSTEARSTHLGADGLSPWENAIWYLSEAIPLSMTWPLAILAALGAILIVWKHRPRQVLLFWFSAIFLTGISLSPLHWHRWIIQILPLLALFAAYAVDTIFTFLSTRVCLSQSAQTILQASIVLLVSVWPAFQLTVHDIRAASPSTRVLARDWVIRNLPSGSQIAQEWYTVPLAGTDFVILQLVSLTERPSLDAYRADGYPYLVASSSMYDRFLAEPDRYPSEIAFYQTLFAEGELLRQFEPSLVRGGPVILIYKID